MAEASAVSRRDFGPYYTFDHVQNACQRCGGTEGFLVCPLLVIVDGIHSLFQEYQQRLVINIFCSDGVNYHRLNQNFNCAELSPDCLDVVLEALHFVHYHGCFC